MRKAEVTADAFVPELVRLWDAVNELSGRAGLKPETREWERRDWLERSTNDHIGATERAASFAPVEGPSGAILLLGLIDDAAAALECLVPATADDKAGELRDAVARMAYAVVRWIEATHGIDRADGAGKVYLPASCDPFDPSQNKR